MYELVGPVIEDYRQIFVDQSKLLEPSAFNHLVGLAKQSKRSLEPLLMEKSFISPSQFLQLSSEYFKLPTTSLKVSEVKHGALHYLAQQDAQDLLAIPFDYDDHTIKVAVAHPNHTNFEPKLRNNNQLDIEIYVTTEQAIRQALILYDPSIKEVLEKMPKKEDGDYRGDLPIEALAISIIETAVILEASDVHIEPYEDTVLVRLRIDGLLEQAASIPTNLFNGLTAYFKVQSQLKIDQTRMPQDGRFSISVKGQEVNVRISLVPSLWGEKMLLRILPKEAHLYDLNGLGFLETDLELIRKNLKRPFGMILVSGPTGSGKTTTLYSFLQEIGMEKANIVNMSTIEDPIEYTIPRVTQIQTNPDMNLTFANGLRALLRQDPDIIMVGEIRDEETADISVRAALVGRLVISSIHTNNALGVMPRLLDMGVEPYLVSSTLAMIVAQRLARKLCTYCRQSYELDDQVFERLNQGHDVHRSLENLQKLGVISDSDYHNLRFFQATGCDKCSNTGYMGRTGLYEVLEITDDIRKNITQHTDMVTLQKIAIAGGMKTMFDDGLAKVTLGLIDLDELLRVVYEE
jgi:type IV pilus assembly protein PilB